MTDNQSLLNSNDEYQINEVYSMLFRKTATPNSTINFEKYLHISYYLYLILKIKKVYSITW